MVTVVKATGEREPFSEEKLRASLRRAGVPQTLHDQVVERIKSKLYENITTEEIYTYVTDYLGATSPYARARFNLKKALMSLGPTGYPFEDFIAKLLQTQGYETQTRQLLQGRCVMHEVDVVAEKNGKKIIVEAKYHNMPGTKTNVHVALYTKARFDDVKEKNNIMESWIITNTKISMDAIAYAECNNMKVISWNYPQGESLRDLVEKSGLTPITALTSLSETQKRTLAQKGLVLSKDLCNEESLLALHLPQTEKLELLEEIKFACNVPQI